MPISSINHTGLRRFLAGFLILLACVLVPLVSSPAQRRNKEQPPSVTGVSSRTSANSDVVSLAVDGALNGIQTWQDPDGTFHLILPGSGASPVKDSPSGVKVRRVGNSLEIEVQAKRGSSVTVQPRLNQLDLVVNGGIDRRTVANHNEVARIRSTPARRVLAPPSLYSRHARGSAVPSSRRETGSKGQETSKPSVAVLPLEKTVAFSTAEPEIKSQAPVVYVPPAVATVEQPAATIPTQETLPEGLGNAPAEESSFLSDKLYSGWWVTLLLIALLVGLLYWRRRDSGVWEDVEDKTTSTLAAIPADLVDSYGVKGESRQIARPHQIGSGSRGENSSEGNRGRSEFVASQEQRLQTRSHATEFAPAGLFGAYRVDQEVGKLVLGQPYRMDVLTSRGADDRRAMESALLKPLRSPDRYEEGLRRARQALEEYGFVARQSAAVLLAQNAVDRVAAARMLGEVGSPGSLQFLLEALYDTEGTVRTQAVESIGALKLPSAIGALLDIARKYPDVSTSVLSKALNACSIDSMEIVDSTPGQSALLLSDGSESFTSEIKQLEPSATFQGLPDSVDDEVFEATLAQLHSQDAEARASAAQTLAIYRVQRSVLALKLLASTDPAPSVRSSAVASLGDIDHESVFSSVLVALADEARDVRAAGARAVSRLSFDRAGAYVRVIEVSDEQELSDVAAACIKTGMATQALDRLASEDRRQAYEAFSLLSLLAKANTCQPILDVIERHADINASLIAVKLLGLSGPPTIVNQLRQLAVRDGMPEQLKKAIMVVVYRIDEMQPA